MKVSGFRNALIGLVSTAAACSGQIGDPPQEMREENNVEDTGVQVSPGVDTGFAAVDTGVTLDPADTGVSQGPVDTGVSQGPVDTGVSQGPVDTGVSQDPIDSGVRADTGVQNPPDTGVSSPDVGFAPDVGPIVTTPRTSASVYWVGHSLIDGTDFRSSANRNVIRTVGFLANADGRTYSQFSHVTPGAPLSWNWHREPGMTQGLLQTAANYDAIVLTERILIRESIQWEDSVFYTRQFACSALAGNANTQIYIYETWPHLHASSGHPLYPSEPELWDFSAFIRSDLSAFEQIANGITQTVTPPSRYSWQFTGTDPRLGCSISASQVNIIPGGQALARLAERIRSPRPTDNWEGLTMGDFFLNGYANWPSSWPVTPQQASSINGASIVAGLRLADPSISFDDIHISFLGSYLVGCVAYATIYRASPVGLPPVSGMSSNMARQLQTLAWEVVTQYPRSGVAP